MTSQPRPGNESLLRVLDKVLRGGFSPRAAGSANDGSVDAPVTKLIALGVMLGAIYGVCLGANLVFRGSPAAWMQVVANAWKVPLLFVLTIVVTFPSLYVFTALQRLDLGFRSTLRLAVLAIVVHTTVAASLGPVFAFFAASTTSYPFLLLLNVAFFAVGGLIGFSVLLRAAPDAQARRVLAVWCLVYGIVGAQMAWLLRPFVGAPDLPFELFRPREDNVLIGILRVIGDLFRR